MINILCGEDLEARQVEVEISCDRPGWMNLGKMFHNPGTKSEILSDMNPDSIYPRNLNSLIIKEVSDLNKVKVYIDINVEKLVFEGSKESLVGIGESIYNYFSDDDVYNGLHFHLYYSPPDIDSFCLLAPTNCCLIFVYRDLK